MKKIFTIAMTIVAVCALLVSCKGDESVPDGMKLASGEAASYSLFIPEDWVIDLQTAATTAHVASTDRSNISAMAWTLENTDDTVDTWYETAVSDLNASFTDFSEESVTETTLDGVYAKDFIYTAKLGGDVRKYRQVAAVKNGTVYVLTYSTTPELFDEHNGEMNDIVSNFRFK